ncbi:nucleoside-diphosphate kinase [Candidatus Woesearchaeota archaeon]|nr:MAG: nucleoside-diphosphate kinase [archaeon GW2011_AR18]MBS3162030.1 nucleoside-diphosphate kinase [Candidatus Woesearchaeota archaeon]HIH25931.1 nucleoside-diphosphate kinase [Nanoarchaeota archaeon]
MIERTLVLLKPDAVKRCLIGTIITRFENAGLKIVGMKMIWADNERALKHYTEDITIRRGQFVRDKLLKFLVEGPVVAICLEGIDSVEVVRKIVGSTEPKTAPPGTIRGDFAHMSYTYADNNNRAIPNLIHASGNREEAISELGLWFSDKELHSYNTVHDSQVI